MYVTASGEDLFWYKLLFLFLYYYIGLAMTTFSIFGGWKTWLHGITVVQWCSHLCRTTGCSVSWQHTNEINIQANRNTLLYSLNGLRTTNRLLKFLWFLWRVNMFLPILKRGIGGSFLCLKWQPVAGWCEQLYVEHSTRYHFLVCKGWVKTSKI